MLIYVTVPDKDTAFRLAKSSVEAGLAAGANIAGPCNSIYRWQGQIHEGQEWQIFFQTSTFELLEQHLAARHPHITPCIIGINLDKGQAAFLEWIDNAGKDKC